MSSKTDITTELRDWAATICSIRGDATPGRKSQMVRDAADEIDRLRAEVAALKADRQAANEALRDARCGRGKPMESDTPRTDANDWITQVASVNLTGQDCVEEERVVDAAFARKLERELDAAIKERNGLRYDRTGLIAECDCLRSERQMYWRMKKELERELAAANAQLVSKADELAAMRQQRDEAHGLIRKWRLNLVDVVEIGDYMDAMTSEARIKMNDSDKRAFLAATAKEEGGA
jgi:hypothetical protein